MKLNSLLILVLVLLSCENQRKSEFKYHLDIDKQIQSKSWEELFSKIEILPLSLPDDSIWIGKIDAYKVYNSCIYVLDGTQSKSITRFDLNGNFISQLDDSGTGPNNYNEINAFTVNSDNKELIIYDRSKLRFFIFDLDSLTYIRQVKTDSYFVNIEYLSKSKDFLFFTDEISPKSVVSIVYKGSLNENKLDIVLSSSYQNVVNVSEYFLYNSSQKYFIIPFEEKVFSFNDTLNQFEPVIDFDVKGQDFPEKLLRGSDILALQDYYFANNDLFFYFFNFSDWKGQFNALFHKGIDEYGFIRLDTTNHVKYELFDWDRTMGAEAPIPFLFMSGNYMSVSYLDAIELKLLRERFDIDISGLSRNSKLADTGYLIKYYLK